MQINRLLTIVIPAYNMEKYLHRCLDSIIVESVMDEVQVIVVNDGSKDRTSEIAHEYEKKYPHYIQVIDKENGNYGSCMNAGLSHAEGKYFRTLDADDWYDSEAFIKFIDELGNTDADLLITERVEINERNSDRILIGFDKGLTLNEDICPSEDLWKRIGFLFVASICYKTSILKSVKMFWDENVFYTDNEYVTIPLKEVRIVRLMNIPVYVYNIGRDEQSVNPNNLMKNYHSHVVVAKRLLGTVLTKEYQESSNYIVIKKVLLDAVLPHVYRTLLYNGFKNLSIVREIDKELIEHDPSLYQKTEKLDCYKGHFYIKEFREKKLVYLYSLIDYRLRSNSFLRRLLKH